MKCLSSFGETILTDASWPFLLSVGLLVKVSCTHDIKISSAHARSKPTLRNIHAVVLIQECVV